MIPLGIQGLKEAHEMRDTIEDLATAIMKVIHFLPLPAAAILHDAIARARTAECQSRDWPGFVSGDDEVPGGKYGQT